MNLRRLRHLRLRSPFYFVEVGKLSFPETVKNIWQSNNYVRKESNKRWWEFWKRSYTYVCVPNDQSMEDALRGRIVKVTGTPTWVPEQPKGGRVTKAMPRDLKKLKEAQEKSVEQD